MGAVTEGFAREDHLAAEAFHCVDLDGRACFRHDNGGLAAKMPCGKGNALGVVSGRGSNDTTLELITGELRHLVVGAAQLEGKDGLGVLALQQNSVAQTF